LCNASCPYSYTYTIPGNLDLAGVAPLLCAGITTYAPYKDHGFDKPGLKVGVVGLGGLGHMAVKFGVAFGCEVYVISRSRSKEELAVKMGAKAIIPSGDSEEMKKYAGRR
jgi:D-arabinose 1-dehydrogenase-like Zn-dependent alcohol dehydrogenase